MAKGSDVEQQAAVEPEADAASGVRDTAAEEIPIKEESHGARLNELTGSLMKSTAMLDDPAGQPTPFDPPFGGPFSGLSPFLQDAVLLALLGGAMRAFGSGFLQAIAQFTDLWMRADANLETALSFIEELHAMHCDPVVGLKTGIATCLSLMGGMPMGSEAGLGVSAAAAGTLLGGRLRSFKLQANVQRRVYVLSAMCSAFAALLPSPLVSILLVLELSEPVEVLGLTYMHIITLLAFGASFAIYFGIDGYPYYCPIALLMTGISGAGYDSMGILTGILFGFGGSAFGLVYILIAGLVKKAVSSTCAKLGAINGRWPRVVVMATASGVFIGALGWAMPLVLTDGSAQLGTVI